MYDAVAAAAAANGGNAMNMLQDIGKRQLHVTDDAGHLRRRRRQRRRVSPSLRQRGHNSNFPLPLLLGPTHIVQKRDQW